jgi:Mn2+/Fe2+ NRAMP family transporter
MKTPRQSPITKLLALIGPGLFLIGYNIGTGSVTAMAKAGSKYGMGLTWTVVISCIFTFVGLIFFTRYTLVSGDTILYGIKRRFPYGKQISLFIMGSVILAEFSGITGLTAIIVDMLREGVKFAFGWEGNSVKILMTALVASTLFVILWMGTYAILEKLLAVLVTLMGVCFLITAIKVVPSWNDILSGLVPGVPSEEGSALIVGSMVGTTFSSALLYCRSIIVKQKGWALAQEKQGRNDALISVGMMFFLSIAVMICAAGTLFVKQMPITNTVDMVETLEPLAGRFAILVFIVGIVGAGLSSLIPTILIAPWLISDYKNQPIDPKSPYSRVFVCLAILTGILAPFIPKEVANPVTIMLITMALLAVILPLSTIAITVLLNQEEAMGEHKNSLLMNVVCACTIIFSVIMAVITVFGLIEEISAIVQRVG